MPADVSRENLRHLFCIHTFRQFADSFQIAVASAGEPDVFFSGLLLQFKIKIRFTHPV